MTFLIEFDGLCRWVRNLRRTVALKYIEPAVNVLFDGSFYLSPRVDEDEEIIVKAMTDYWVVGKKSDQRELYVILNQKNANLIEVNGTSPPAGDE